MGWGARLVGHKQGFLNYFFAYVLFLPLSRLGPTLTMCFALMPEKPTLSPIEQHISCSFKNACVAICGGRRPNSLCLIFGAQLTLKSLLPG